jgi:integrase
VLFVPWSKTDQEARGAEIALRHTQDARIDPIAAIAEWRSVSGISSGPLLRGFWKTGAVRAKGMAAASVNVLLREMVGWSGVSEEDVAKFSGHSLRAGFITSARAAGVPDHVIMRTTRHVDARTLNTYTRERDLFANAAEAAAW